MVLLYKDPKGEFITDNTLTHSIHQVSMRENVLKLNNCPSRSQIGSDGQGSLEVATVAETNTSS